MQAALLACSLHNSPCKPPCLAVVDEGLKLFGEDADYGAIAREIEGVPGVVAHGLVRGFLCLHLLLKFLNSVLGAERSLERLRACRGWRHMGC